jgi:hypothetical protein
MAMLGSMTSRMYGKKLPMVVCCYLLGSGPSIAEAPVGPMKAR